MANRTIQFCGYAYGAVPVQLNAHINGQLVFSGAVDTLLDEVPTFPIDMTNAPVLFLVPESALFPTSFSGSYPMTVSVATGDGLALGFTNSNYMTSTSDAVEFSGAISGTVLSVSDVTSGEILSGQRITGVGIAENTRIISGNAATWEVSPSQTTTETSITGRTIVTGTVDTFVHCFNGIPANSEGTQDSRSSVQLNGVSITPDRTAAWPGQWTWWVTAGSTIEYNLNVSLGDE